MPEISRFFGIIIRMFAEPDTPHHRPHRAELTTDWQRLQSGRAPFPNRTVAMSAKAMGHSLYRVTSCKVIEPFVLSIRFDDGTERRIDFRPVLRGELYGPLRDSTLFEQVRIDPDARTLVWPNGADFDPTTLHDWPESGPRMIEMARGWTDG